MKLITSSFLSLLAQDQLHKNKAWSWLGVLFVDTSAGQEAASHSACACILRTDCTTLHPLQQERTSITKHI